MNAMEQRMLEAGYVRDPNNVNSLPGSLWYSGAPNVKGCPAGKYIQVLHDRIRIFTQEFFGEWYTKRSYIDTVTVEVFETFEQFAKWMAENGKNAHATTAFSNVMD